MEARGLSKDRAWGRVSEEAGREEVKVSARKKKKAQAGACSWGSNNVLGLLPSFPSSRYAREPLVLERLRELHQLGRN